MATKVRKVQYFYATVHGELDDAFATLTHLAAQGVNLLAINTVPVGPEITQFTIFPEEGSRFTEAARAAGLSIEGPHRALLVHGDDEVGAVARVHSRLHRAGVEVYASNAVTDGRGFFGCVLYVRASDADRGATALES